VNAEFNWWLLIVGVVVGALLTWLVLADSARREHDIAEQEVPAEANWLARTLADEGHHVDPPVAEALLRAHRRYLRLPPPDAFVDPETLERVDLADDQDGPLPPRDEPMADARITPPATPQGRPERGAAG
jgi:hypothetical protein